MTQGIQFGSLTAAVGDVVVSGLGFTPVAVVFWLSERTAVTTGADGDAVIATGFTDGTTGFCSGSAVQDNAASTFRGFAAALPIHMRDADGTLNCEATGVTFNAGGFTVAFGTAVASYLVQFLAIGGSGVEAKVGTIVSPGSATTVESASLGFTPVGVLLAASHQGALPLDGSSAVAFFGAASDTLVAESGSASWGKINSGGSDPAQSIATDGLMKSQDSLLNNDETFKLSALGSDTFTLDFTSSANSTMNYGFLALKGVSIFVLEVDSPTSAGSASLTGAGFTPTGALIFGTGTDAAHAVDDTGGSQFAVGAVDDEGNEGYIVQQNKAGSLSDGNMVYDIATGSIIGATDETGVGSHTVVDEASLTGFTSDGMDIEWDIADGVARHYVFVMLKGGLELSGYANGIIFADDA